MQEKFAVVDDNNVLVDVISTEVPIGLAAPDGWQYVSIEYYEGDLDIGWIWDGEHFNPPA